MVVGKQISTPHYGVAPTNRTGARRPSSTTTITQKNNYGTVNNINGTLSTNTPDETNRYLVVAVEAGYRVLPLQVSVPAVYPAEPQPKPALAPVLAYALLDDVQHANEAAEDEHPAKTNRTNACTYRG